MSVAFMQSLIGAVLKVIVDIDGFLTIISLRHADIYYIFTVNIYYLCIAVNKNTPINLLRIVEHIEEILN